MALAFDIVSPLGAMIHKPKSEHITLRLEPELRTAIEAAANEDRRPPANSSIGHHGFAVLESMTLLNVIQSAQLEGTTIASGAMTGKPLIEIEASKEQRFMLALN